MEKLELKTTNKYLKEKKTKHKFKPVFAWQHSQNIWHNGRVSLATYWESDKKSESDEREGEMRPAARRKRTEGDINVRNGDLIATEDIQESIANVAKKYVNYVKSGKLYLISW